MNQSTMITDQSPLRNRSYSPVVSPQKNVIQMNNYSKQPMSLYPQSASSTLQNQYLQVTPPRSNHIQHINTPSTAQTLYSINGSAPSRFNHALDQVCLLGHEMDTMRKNFELVSVELQQWKEKCALIKTIASTPPPGTNYSPQRINKLRNEVSNQFSAYQTEINKMNSIINGVNNELTISAEKIKSLERKVGEMNKIELEMLSAKKQALELDNRNRFQALELNDLKSKIDTKNHQNDELIKQIMILPQLKESLNILEEENKKLISVIQQKDDQLNRADQKHMQITKMYQENLEKSNQVANQLRELQVENDDVHNEVEKLNDIAESISMQNIRNSQQLSKQRGRNSGEISFDGEELKKSHGLKRSIGGGSQSNMNRSQRVNMKLSQVQTALIDQQTTLDQLQSQIRERDQRLEIITSEKEALFRQIQDQMTDIQKLRNLNMQQQDEQEEKIKKQKREFNESISNTVVPLQKENESMSHEIERLQIEIQSIQVQFQEISLEKESLENQLNLERQQAFNSHQKQQKENEIKCDALTERIIKKETELNNEIIKNKELFEDNKLMAEEMRTLKQKSAELEHWKNKYRELKKETKQLRLQFDEYKQTFIREIQNRFSNGCDQFESYLSQIDERFDSTRNSTQFKNNNDSSQNNNLQYFQSPNRSVRGIESSENQGRTSSPTQEKLKAMKQTPSKSSSVSIKSSNNPNNNSNNKINNNNNNNSSMNYNPMNQSNVSPNLQDMAQIQVNNNNISSFNNNMNNSFSNNNNNNNNNSNYLRNSQNEKYDIMNSQAMKYQSDINQTNQDLDCKLEELVILKAKYEEALNRVHSNIHTTPKK